MTTYIDAQGLQIPTLEETLATLAAEQRAAIDPLLANDAESILGRLNAIVASGHREADEALQNAAWATDPDSAENARLTALARFTGTLREGPRKSSVSLQLLLEPGAVVPAGSQVSVVGSPSTVFETLAETRNDGVVNGIFSVPALATTFGPLAGPLALVSVIETPETGWLAASNPQDADLGRLADEPDTDLRPRRNRELFRQGSSTPPSTVAAFLAFKLADGSRPIRSALFLENTTDLYDLVLGIASHSFKVVFWDGVAAPVSTPDADALLSANRHGGIPGSWARASQVLFSVRVTMKAGASYIGDTLTKAAIVAAYDAALEPGEVVTPAIAGMATLLAGASLVTKIELKLASSGTWLEYTNVAIGDLEIGSLDVSEVSIVTLP